MIKKSIKAQLIEALNKNDSKAIREACIKLQASEKSIDGFFDYYNVACDEKGNIISNDSTPFNYDKYKYQYISEYLETSDRNTINNFKKQLEDYAKKHSLYNGE